ncbi:SpoIID/LytB domain-containing protein [Candidatus Dependentiae bacterium]|nr:SpoIID/LytB domain-containing protein [Candidatus Dependentiae bacterium]
MYFLVKKLKRIVVAVFLLTGYVHSFDVKVLLARYKMQEVAPSKIELICPDGFVLSYNSKFALGSQFPHRRLIISHTDDVVKINGKVLSEKILHIFPKLSHVVELQLKSQVSYWFEAYDIQVQRRMLELKDMFEEMLLLDTPLSENHKNQLIISAQSIFQMYLAYIQDTYKDLESHQKLLDTYSNEFLDLKFLKRFAEALENKHVTLEYRKILLKNKKKMYDFFSEQLSNTLQDLLCEFLYALPRKIIQHMVQDKIAMIEYDTCKYQGSFIIFHDKKQLLLINGIDINDYLLSVVRHEGYPGWSIEMNKIVAITCRTYLVHQVLQSQRVDREYHIENKNNHQTYKGYHDCSKIRQAVEETKNMILGYNGRPACTMYDVCCGGVIPAAIEDSDLKRTPYLARTYQCTFCKNHKAYSWSLDFSSEEVLTRLKREFLKLDKISDINVYKKDKAGLVKKVIIISGTQRIILTEKKFKSFFPEMKSYCCDIKKIHRRFFIEGKGFGHHRGLCQWGAYHLVKNQHWNFAEVLQFYYPGTNIMKLNY